MRTQKDVLTASYEFEYIKGIQNTILTILFKLTSFYLQLLSIGWFHKSLTEKPDHINQPQEWKECKSTCT